MTNPVLGTVTLNKDFTIKCPSFTPEKPELFFKLFRSLLRTQGVTDKIRQFNLDFLQLPARVQEKCENLLENPNDDSLDELEKETLAIYSTTGEKKTSEITDPVCSRQSHLQRITSANQGTARPERRRKQRVSATPFF